jgi:hypothetical protein
MNFREIEVKYLSLAWKLGLHNQLTKIGTSRGPMYGNYDTS